MFEISINARETRRFRASFPSTSFIIIIRYDLATTLFKRNRENPETQSPSPPRDETNGFSSQRKNPFHRETPLEISVPSASYSKTKRRISHNTWKLKFLLFNTAEEN